jgi:hypothetical protein
MSVGGGSNVKGHDFQYIVPRNWLVKQGDQEIPDMTRQITFEDNELN